MMKISSASLVLQTWQPQRLPPASVYSKGKPNGFQLSQPYRMQIPIRIAAGSPARIWNSCMGLNVVRGLRADVPAYLCDATIHPCSSYRSAFLAGKVASTTGSADLEDWPSYDHGFRYLLKSTLKCGADVGSEAYRTAVRIIRLFTILVILDVC